jgi:hypothetical protein
MSTRFGSAMRMQGEAAMSRSPVAALKMVDTQRYTSSTDPGASFPLSAFTQA